MGVKIDGREYSFYSAGIKVYGLRLEKDSRSEGESLGYYRRVRDEIKNFVTDIDQYIKRV